MISTNSSLLERPQNTELVCCSGTSNGIEIALFRARAAMLDGWAFTPEGVQAYTNPQTWHPDSSQFYAPRIADEDEIEDTALFFAD